MFFLENFEFCFSWCAALAGFFFFSFVCLLCRALLMESSMADETIANPLVFQCEKCRVILGDTFSLVTADGEMQMVCLELASPHVVVDKDAFLVSPASARDAGSTFHILKCASCKAVLGRQYKTTDAAMDPWRGKFALSTKSISSYQLGKGSQGIDQLFSTYHSLSRVSEDLLKVQQMLILFSERIQALEQAAAVVPSSSSATGKTGPGGSSSLVEHSEFKRNAPDDFAYQDSQPALKKKKR
eukprot:ANDGO_03088.mRNA.1 Kinetochore protein mis18